MRKLNWAAKIAAESKDQNKNFFLACVALREDGTYVHSTNNTVIQEKTPSAHAEARVLRKAGVGAILWVARVLKDRQTWATARPCERCQALIINKGVKKVYYTIGPDEYGVWIPSEGEASNG